MGKERTFTLTNLLLALCLMLFAICAAVVVALNFRPLYYFSVDYLDIPYWSGLEKAEILANYDALIDYNSLFYRRALALPTLPTSETGRIHFEEVKVIFDTVQLLAMTALAAGAVGCVQKLRRGKIAFFKLAAVLTLAVPLVVAALVAVGWQWFFVLFHKVFFNNDYWIFDAATDPVITILPDGFFLFCLLLILALVVLAAAAYGVAYGLLKRRRAKRLQKT